MSAAGWTGIDLDGTLAEHYWPHKGPFDIHRIGDPIAPMVRLVREMIAAGHDVRIFTARVDGLISATIDASDADDIASTIQAWCVKHIGRALPVTNRKDHAMEVLYDDRCIQVEFNTGRLIRLE